ncbi:MAG: hypothetical protein ACFCBW_23230, partial [Candidatus Competibacterales bacterium]
VESGVALGVVGTGSAAANVALGVLGVGLVGAFVLEELHDYRHRPWTVRPRPVEPPPDYRALLPPPVWRNRAPPLMGRPEW